MPNEFNMVIVKGLIDSQAKDLVKWFEYLNERYKSIDYKNNIVDSDTCDVSFELRKFDVEIHYSYIQFTLRGYQSEHFSIYADDIQHIEFH